MMWILCIIVGAAIIAASLSLLIGVVYLLDLLNENGKKIPRPLKAIATGMAVAFIAGALLWSAYATGCSFLYAIGACESCKLEDK